MWIAAGEAASLGVARAKEPLEEWVAALPEAECRRMLLRAVQDESNSGLYLRNELRQRFAAPISTQAAGKPRTIGQLLTQVEESTRRAKEEKRRQADLQRKQRLESLTRQEPALWSQVTSLIQQKTTKGYDQAIEVLRDLRELAQLRDERASFDQRVAQIQAQFPTLSGLKSRLIAAKLLKR